MLDLNDMYYFVQVVDHKSISAAARALSLPKSTISYRMNQLEVRLGARLFNRTSRQLAVTDIGSEFYRRAQIMIRDAQSAEYAVRQRLSTPSGLVRLTVAVATAQFAMRGLLTEFCRQYPQVKVVQRTSDTEVDIVKERYDMAIRSHSLPLRDSNLIQRRLAPTPWMLFCSPSLLKGREPIHGPEDLCNHPALFMARQGSVPQWRLRHENGGTRTMLIDPILMTDCMPTLKDAAIAGLGIVALPGYICKEEIAQGSLVRVMPEWTAADAAITALLPYGQNQLPSIRVLLDYLAAEIPRAVAM
ncbi:LysR substrate-binding domain-containing protein [Burkholderia gladioli]|uniref:LysR substrate-binding domain-containing protein n=1 Tax=Burkholderia gladioli TaxID=28095 RepID=UPI00163DFAF5|nr:LysR substrate-binding domain-containing protein [Burkholderia gladioli]